MNQKFKTFAKTLTLGMLAILLGESKVAWSEELETEAFDPQPVVGTVNQKNSGCDAGMINWRVAQGGEDLVQTSDFSGLEGAEKLGGKVCFSPVGRSIVGMPNEETTEGWWPGKSHHPDFSNPPIDFTGPRIATKGAWGLKAQLTAEKEAGGFLDFYGEPPMIQDEAKRESPRLSFGLQNGKVVFRVWSGKSPSPKTYSFGSDSRRKAEVEVREVGQDFQIWISGNAVGRIPNPGIFKSGFAYLGADVPLSGRLCIHSLSVLEPTGAAGKTRVVIPQPFEAVPVPSDSLRALGAKKKIDIGTCVATGPLLTDPAYRKKLAENFSMITPENAMKFEFIHPSNGKYAFKEADAIVDFAKTNHIKVHAHTLVWGESVPAWIRDGHFTNAELRKIMEDHIKTVVGHFRGKVAEWDVLNEPLEDEGDQRNTIWKKAFGKDYPAIFFKWAHEADPGAKLFINEYGAEEKDSKRPQGLSHLINEIRSGGGRVDGIGLQSHEELNDPPSRSRVEGLMQRFQAQGVETRISELDVGMPDHPTAKDYRKQAQIHQEMLQACLSQSKNCHTVATWGFDDRYSSMQDNESMYEPGQGEGKSMMFDRDLKPRPTYRALQSALK